MRLIVLILLPLLFVSAAAQDCVIGNSQGLFGYELGWVQSGAMYAQFTQPQADNCACDSGFEVDEVRIRLLLEAGATVTLRAHLVEADDVAGCDVPGLILETSDPVLFADASATGVYEIAIPCDFQCAVVWYRYFLVVEITGLSGVAEMPFTSANTGVPDKQAPGDPCTAYRDVGAGWEDMIMAGFGGGLPIEAAVSCCGDPIEHGVGAWGDRASPEFNPTPPRGGITRGTHKKPLTSSTTTVRSGRC